MSMIDDGEWRLGIGFTFEESPQEVMSSWLLDRRGVRFGNPRTPDAVGVPVAEVRKWGSPVGVRRWVY